MVSLLKGKVSAGMYGRVIRNKKYLGEVEVESVQKEKMDVDTLIEKEVGGLALKTEKKIAMEVGDRIQFFTRETRKKTL